MKLTAKMRDTLDSAREFTDGLGGAVGMFPRDIGQQSSMRALLRRGLVEFYGWGRDVDCERDNDVPIYKITDAGRAELGADNADNVRALAEHRAELLKLQDDLLQAANREVALEATIEQLGKDGAVLATENERLKVDLSIERRAYDETLYRLKAELADTLAAYDRLKAELAECEAALQLGREGIQAYCDSENAMREKLDRAVELVREFATTRACLCSATHGGMSAENHYKGCRVLAFLAAAPPPGAPSCTASAGSCNSPKACGEAGRCIDARMREVVAPPAESTPVQSAPPDDIQERLEPHERPKADREWSTKRRLAALEAKGEPGIDMMAVLKKALDANAKGAKP